MYTKKNTFHKAGESKKGATPTHKEPFETLLYTNCVCHALGAAATNHENNNSRSQVEGARSKHAF